MRGTFGDKEKGFARCIYGAEEISPQRFEQLAAWRLENFGKVTGLVEIDFDKGILSALNIMDGWQSFRLKDVSSAAYFADKSGHVNKEVRWNIFLSRLEGKQLTSHTQTPVELHGSRRLRPEEIIFSDEISELDGRLNFYMDCSFNPDEVFGTHVDSADNNNWLNIYAEYDLENSQVCDALKVILCREDGFDYEMAYQLNAEEKSAILDKMGQYTQSAPLRSTNKDWDEDLKEQHGLEPQPPEEHPQLIVAGTICERIGAKCKAVRPEQASYQIPRLLQQYQNDLHWGRFEQAMDHMETMSALALSVVLRECRQMGTVLTEEQGARFLQSHIHPHQNRGSLKTRATEIGMEFQSVLAKDAVEGIRTEVEKKATASAWLELAISCAKVPIKYCADELRRQQKEEKALLEAAQAMASY